jgi:hypothetical protein
MSLFGAGNSGDYVMISMKNCVHSCGIEQVYRDLYFVKYHASHNPGSLRTSASNLFGEVAN